MERDKLWWAIVGLSAAMLFVVACMVVTLEPSRGAWQKVAQESALAPKKEESGPVTSEQRENDLSFDKMLNNAKETYFSMFSKEDADRNQVKAYAREQAIRAQSLARTKDQRFRSLFLLSVLADAEERKDVLPANGQKLMEMADDDSQKGRAQYILAEGHKENQRNQEAVEAYKRAAKYLLGDGISSKTDRVFGVWQLGRAADVVEMRLKEPERAEKMYEDALKQLDEERTIPELDGPIREAILLNMTSLYKSEGEDSEKNKALAQRQQDVMQQMKKTHPERTSAYIAEQWERIKLNKI